MTEKVSKKRKVEENINVEENQKRATDAGLWFEDGNIILIAQYTPFKVHRGLLSRKSEVFRDMFTLPPPESPNKCDLMDGIPIVHMSDNWEDLSIVLSVLYDGQAFFGFQQQIIHFQTIAALLRLGHKYGLTELEQEAIARLKRLFPTELDDFFDEYTGSKYDRDNRSLCCPDSKIHLKSSDAVEAINLARTYNIPSILPSAFYICSRLPINLLVKGVPTLGSRVSRNMLSRADLVRCLEGQIELSRRYVLRWETLHEAIGKGSCIDTKLCLSSKLEWAKEGHRAWQYQDAIGCCLLDSDWATSGRSQELLCDGCDGKRESLWEKFRRETWNDLSVIFDLQNNKARGT
ncbi:hypothetical protein QCA50_005624 [Cerrena zonata]|uniref:BTB domain-containing protein n=1 Tax=Cerrena zonata TaxID=2478898 RepID=A0AAW0GLR5_9APHY